MNILRFEQFVNESFSINESGIPLYKGSNFNPERTIKRNRLLPELQDLLGQVMSGSISELTVLADIPTQGKNAPQYVKDMYRDMGMPGYGEESEMADDSLEIEDDVYDPETGEYKRTDYEEKEKNIFIDSEFIVKDVDMTKGVILGVPYSLKKKNIVVELDPESIDEVFIK
jgi:hypothetical protein